MLQFITIQHGFFAHVCTHYERTLSFGVGTTVRNGRIEQKGITGSQRHFSSFSAIGWKQKVINYLINVHVVRTYHSCQGVKHINVDVAL